MRRIPDLLGDPFEGWTGDDDFSFLLLSVGGLPMFEFRRRKCGEDIEDCVFL
jgi:hypothetical protein